MTEDGQSKRFFCHLSSVFRLLSSVFCNLKVFLRFLLVAGEAAGIVETEAVGLCFTPEDASELVETLLRLKNDAPLRRRLSANGVAAAPKYRRDALAEKMLGLLAEIHR